MTHHTPAHSWTPLSHLSPGLRGEHVRGTDSPSTVTSSPLPRRDPKGSEGSVVVSSARRKDSFVGELAPGLGPAACQWPVGFRWLRRREVAKPTADFLVSWFHPSCPTYDAHDRSASYSLGGSAPHGMCAGATAIPGGQLKSQTKPRHLWGFPFVSFERQCGLWLDCGLCPQSAWV